MNFTAINFILCIQMYFFYVLKHNWFSNFSAATAPCFGLQTSVRAAQGGDGKDPPLELYDLHKNKGMCDWEPRNENLLHCSCNGFATAGSWDPKSAWPLCRCSEKRTPEMLQGTQWHLVLHPVFRTAALEHLSGQAHDFYISQSFPEIKSGQSSQQLWDTSINYMWGLHGCTDPCFDQPRLKLRQNVEKIH